LCAHGEEGEKPGKTGKPFAIETNLEQKSHCICGYLPDIFACVRACACLFVCVRQANKTFALSQVCLVFQFILSVSKMESESGCESESESGETFTRVHNKGRANSHVNTHIKQIANTHGHG